MLYIGLTEGCTYEARRAELQRRPATPWKMGCSIKTNCAAGRKEVNVYCSLRIKVPKPFLDPSISFHAQQPRPWQHAPLRREWDVALCLHAPLVAVAALRQASAPCPVRNALD